jgi:hypothetical protein
MENVGLFGPPQHFITDGGPAFVADFTKALLKQMSVFQYTITPYSHEENSLVERSHSETLNHLRAIMYDRNLHNDWSSAVPLVQRIMNATYHSAIKATPASIIFGNSVNLDAGVLFPHPISDSPVNYRVWLDKMLAYQAYIVRKVQATLQEHEEQHALTRQPRPLTQFQAGTYVLCSYPNGPLTRPPTKLHPIWKGPYRVLNHTDSTYFIQNILSGKVAKVHISRLKPFKYDAERVNPRNVALRDTQEFVVERVLEHFGPISKKNELEFKVRWLGYGEDTDLWLPWRELRNNPALHRYLHEQHLDRLIPKEHRRDNYDDVHDDIDWFDPPNLNPNDWFDPAQDE